MSHETQVGQQFHHSVVYRHNGSLRKHLEPTTLFSHEDTILWRRRILAYRRMLQEIGLRVADPYHIEVHEGQIFEHTRDYGPDVIARMKADELPLTWARKIVRAILPVLTLGARIIGLDPVPGNFCVDDDGELVFIDFMPPRLIDQGVPLVGFPQPDSEEEVGYAHQRYYEPFGMLRKLWFILVRIRPSLSTHFFEILQEELPAPLMDELSEQFRSLPYTQATQDPSLLPQLVEPLTLHNIDDLRELALHLMSLNGLKRYFLQEVFELTHADFRLEISVRQEKFETAKRLVLHRFQHR